MPTLYVITNSGNKAVIGTYLPLHLADLRHYVRRYPLAWVIA